ncbi:unnamed protein product, partial [Nesidiocoris tenuis]
MGSGRNRSGDSARRRAVTLTSDAGGRDELSLSPSPLSGIPIPSFTFTSHESLANCCKCNKSGMRRRTWGMRRKNCSNCLKFENRIGSSSLIAHNIKKFPVLVIIFTGHQLCVDNTQYFNILT